MRPLGPADKEIIRNWALEAGACACGFAKAESVEAAALKIYDDWLEAGRQGEMAYCEKYADVRTDPRLLLDGGRSIIACAFSYRQPKTSSLIASYALGQDYHYVLKGRLFALAEKIKAAYGGEARAMVDTAPIRERYWAQKAGIGFVGLNNQLIVPGYGSYCFLGELIVTVDIEPDSPSTASCLQCGACMKACPPRALDGKGACDTSRCISYLTIEHRGPLPADAILAGKICGCDACQQCCPHNAGIPPTPIPEFAPQPELLSLDLAALRSMTPSHYKKLTAHSALRRLPLSQLLRNASKEGEHPAPHPGKQVS